MVPRRTRAERLGRTMQPGDFDTRIIRVLPPSLEAMRKADNLDLVINAMRKGKPAEKQSGKSLLQWIGDRGGINDGGGDLKAMGLDAWHREQPGRKKLIREFDPVQGAMPGVDGSGDYGHDSTLRAAVEAGYFPELAGHGTHELDTNDLHSAIADELAGRPRYTEAPKVDPMRAAADDLARMIANEGRDPSGMSDAEIRKFVEEKAKEPVPGGHADDQGKTDGRKVPVTLVDPKTELKVVRITDPQERSREDAISAVKDMRGTYALASGENVQITQNSAKKSMFSNGNPLKWSIAHHLPEIVSDAVRYGSADGHDYAIAKVSIGETAYAVRLILKHARGGDPALQALEGFDVEKWQTFPGPVGDPVWRSASAGSTVGDFVRLFNSLPDGARSAWQSVGDSSHGRISMPADGWGSGPATIELFKSANQSTLFHELGHQWLEELRFDAQHPEASDQLQGDWQTVQKWFASNGHPIGDDGVIPTEAHELFARGIERYLMEGKAPSKSMETIFAKIRAKQDV